MAGKSTYFRQVALLTLLAHTGSLVPAAEARIDLVARIFNHIGASDDLTPEGNVGQARRQQGRHKLKQVAPPPQMDLFG